MFEEAEGGLWARVLEAARCCSAGDSELTEAIATGGQCAGMVGRPFYWPARCRRPLAPAAAPIILKSICFSPLQAAGTDKLTHVFNSSAPTPWPNVTAGSTVGSCWPPLSSPSVKSKLPWMGVALRACTTRTNGSSARLR